MRKILLACICLWFVDKVYTQGTNYALPKITPPSPAAQNFLRYGEIPVDMSTGVPSISVPLYTLKSRKLQFPITASYHASGIKISDRASVIGLGWVLNIKGLLTSTVLSSFNFDTTMRPTYKTAQAFNDARATAGNTGTPGDNFRMLIGLEKDSKDWQSDRFNFQLPTGMSGVFRYDYQNGELLKLPFGSYKVAKTMGPHPSNSSITTLVGFTITDGQGDQYLFGYAPGGNYQYDYQTMDLLKIISADKTDSISFYYKASVANTYDRYSFGSYLETGDDAESTSTQYQPAYVPRATLGLLTNRVIAQERILDSIVSANSVVKITSIADRPDMGIYSNGYRISSMQILNKFSREQIQKIDFNQSYFGTSANNNLRLRLDSVALKGTNEDIVQVYKFDYENNVQLPQAPEDNISMNPVFSEDYWGYYNGTGGTSNIPQEMITSSSFLSPNTGFSVSIPSGAGKNRNPDHYYAKAALIKSITYPTGGKTEFEFEPNHAVNAYYYPGQSPAAGPVGGFRIHQIKNFTGSQTTPDLVKTYTYSPGYTRTISSDLFIYSHRIFKLVSALVEIPGGYSQGGAYATAVDHTIYTSTPLLPLTYENGPPVFYEKVTEYIGDIDNNTGKTENTYLWPNQIIYASYDGPRFQNTLEQDKGNYTPLLARKVEFKNQSGQYFPVRKIINEYSTFKSPYHSTGMNFFSTATFNNISYSAALTYIQDAYFSSYNNDLNSYLHVFDMKASQAVDMLTKTTEYLYSPDTLQTLVNETNYSYDTTSHLQPVQHTWLNSKGETMTSNFTYPINYAGTAVYDTMVNRNIITALIQKADYKNSSLIEAAKTNYNFFSGQIIAPQTVDVQKGSSALETRLQYGNYDSYGNPLEMAKVNNSKHSFLWGYNNQYTTAEVVNAPYASISYTSFETGEKGNWDYSGPVNPSDGITGKNSYSLGGGSIERTALNSSQVYIVSYWLKDGSGSVSVGGTAKLSKHGFTLYEATVSGVTTLTITGTGIIDELRMYPKGAQMTTYTYEPLIGISSQCDVNNRITYYEYDLFNRLKFVRDMDKNILKAYNYQYQEIQ